MLDEEKTTATTKQADSSEAEDKTGETTSTGNTVTEATNQKDDDSAPAILKLIKNQSKMSQSFYITSMQQQKEGMGSTMGGGGHGTRSFMGGMGTSTFLGAGGARGSSSRGVGGGGRPVRPKWLVTEVSMFTQTRAELVLERNVIAATMGINHVGLLTGKHYYNIYICAYTQCHTEFHRRRLEVKSPGQCL